VARVRAGIERGEVARCEPEAIVDLVLTVLDGTIVQSITRGGAEAATVEELWRRVLAPLVVTAAPRPAAKARPRRRPTPRPRSPRP
jgi:hypothetical protein